MANSKPNLKALALAPMSGFRKKAVTVPEWGDVTVVLCEPSAEAWLRLQELAKTGDGEDLSVSDKARRDLRGDVALFVDVVRDDNLQPVFTQEDAEQVEAVYGPVHSRLLRQALDLVTSYDEAKKK